MKKDSPNLYNIHGLVGVRVEIPDERIRKGIATQIGYFSVPHLENNSSLQSIVVRHFRNCPTLSNPNAGTVGNVVLASDDSIAFVKDQWGLERNPKGWALYLSETQRGGPPINLLIQFSLVKTQATLIHAAALEKDGNVYVFPAFGGVGKTGILGELVRKKNYHFLGDDLVCITSDGRCLSYPRSFVFYPYHRRIYHDVFERYNISSHTRAREKVSTFIRENMAFRGLLKSISNKPGKLRDIRKSLRTQPYVAVIPASKIFGKKKIIDSGMIQKFVFLQRYKSSLFKSEEIGLNDLCNRLIAIVHHEFEHESWKLLFAGGGFGIVNLAEYFQNVRNIIKKSLENKETNILYIPESTTLEELAQKVHSVIH